MQAQTIYTQIAFVSWLVLMVIWFIASFGNKKTVRIPNTAEQRIVSILMVISFILLIDSPLFQAIYKVYLYQPGPVIGTVGAGLAVLGVAFAIWARVTLGRNWSGAVVTVKENHELVQTGPYAYVRHPIYSGFLAAALGTSLTLGLLNGFLGTLAMLAAFLIRVRREELLMTEIFPDQYPEYRKKTKALVPWIW